MLDVEQECQMKKCLVNSNRTVSLDYWIKRSSAYDDSRSNSAGKQHPHNPNRDGVECEEKLLHYGWVNNYKHPYVEEGSEASNPDG